MVRDELLFFRSSYDKVGPDCRIDVAILFCLLFLTSLSPVAPFASLADPTGRWEVEGDGKEGRRGRAGTFLNLAAALGIMCPCCYIQTDVLLLSVLSSPSCHAFVNGNRM